MERPQAHRLPQLRPLVQAPGSQTPTGGGRAAADGRAGRRGRGDRDRRRVRPRPPLRAPARLAVPAARRDRRRDAPHRDRHRGDRHALREPALHGRGRGAPPTCISGGRLQLGISRGSPEPALHGSEAFGHVPAEGETDADLAREHTELFRAAIAGEPVVAGRPGDGRRHGRLAIQPQSPGLPDRIWWGAGTRETGVWTADRA